MAQTKLIREQILQFQKAIQAQQQHTNQLESAADNVQFRRQLSLKRNQSHDISKKIFQMFQAAKEQTPEIVKLKKDFSFLLKQYENAQQQQLVKEKELNRALTRRVTQKQRQATNTRSSNIMSSQSSLMTDSSEELQDVNCPLLEDLGDADETILAQREIEIDLLEKDMREVGGMFKDLNEITLEQGEGINKIEEHIEIGNEEIQQANVELVTAQVYQRSTNRKAKCIALIAFIVAAILALIVFFVVIK